MPKRRRAPSPPLVQGGSGSTAGLSAPAGGASAGAALDGGLVVVPRRAAPSGASPALQSTCSLGRRSRVVSGFKKIVKVEPYIYSLGARR